MSTLFPYQIDHKNRLVEILKEFNRALDTSKTGSGKSVTSLSVYKYHFSHLPLVIVCPPTLIANWEKHCHHELGDIEFTIKSSHSLNKTRGLKGFMIVDECHDFKNNVKRTRYLRSLANRMSYTIFMSATPIDDTSQEEHLNLLLGKDVFSKMSQMVFKYPTTLSIIVDHFVLNKTAHDNYKVGYELIWSAARGAQKFRNENDQHVEHPEPIWNAAQGVQHIDHFETFVPEFFTKGLKMIHSVLFSYLLYYLFTQRNYKKKYIIVMRFKEQFENLKIHFPNLLVLNGTIPQKERQENVRLFQTDPDRKMIAISELVGGLGIELDDIIGDAPREILMLPTSNGVNFTQIIGRIQRTNTKSNSVVRIIQPNRDKTYFKNQMLRKAKIMNRFNQLPDFKEHIHCVCPKFDLLVPDVNRLIQEYACDCMNKNL